MSIVTNAGDLPIVRLQNCALVLFLAHDLRGILSDMGETVCAWGSD